MWSRQELSAVILAGGAGHRLGQPKATLEFIPGETLLARKVRQLRPHFERIIIVANKSIHDTQSFESTVAFTDRNEYQGPLIAIAPVFQAYAKQTEKLFVTGCDFPFFHPEFLQILNGSLGSHEISLFNHNNHLVPLAAIYRTHLEKQLTEMVETGQQRLMSFVDICSKSIVSAKALQPFDSGFLSLMNVNTPEDLDTARSASGRTC